MDDKPEVNVLQLTPATFTKVITEYALVLVDFWAEWCPPCVREGEELEIHGTEIVEAFPSIKICKMNVDIDEGISENLGINYIPNMVVFYRDQLAKMEPGLKSVNVIIDFIKDVITLIDNPSQSNMKGLIEIKNFVIHQKSTKKTTKKTSKKSTKKTSKKASKKATSK